MHTLDKLEFLATLEQLPRGHPTGLSEYQLITQLKQQQQPLFIEADLSDALSLFRSHFVLFHLLYSLRDTLRSAGHYDLLISPLSIRLQATRTVTPAAAQAIDISDPLRLYYLNLDHLSATDRSEVERLLYQGRSYFVQPPQVTEALTVLGIKQPLHELDTQTLRHHYRQLVSRHHPDRGGCTERLQRINQAMDPLRAHQTLSRHIL